eukprot:COSAG05_NODE_13631_length_423_cov_0.635802_1_plen_57_part_01
MVTGLGRGADGGPGAAAAAGIRVGSLIAAVGGVSTHLSSSSSSSSSSLSVCLCVCVC